MKIKIFFIILLLILSVTFAYAEIAGVIIGEPSAPIIVSTITGVLTNLSQMADTDTGSANDGEVLTWNATGSVWYPQSQTANIWAIANNGTLAPLATVLGYSYYNSSDFSISDYYLNSNPFSFWNDSTVNFTSAGFNDSVGLLLKTTFFNSTNFVSNRGTDAGNINDSRVYNGNSLNITEETGAVGLNVTFNFTGVTPTFNEIVYRYKNTAGENHQIHVQLYDFDDSSWENYNVISAVPSYVLFSSPVLDPNKHLSGGLVRVRFVSDGIGNVNHVHYFDYVAISKGVATPSGEEIDPLSIHKDGDVELTGQWNYGSNNINGSGNLTGSYIFGNGSQLTSVPVTVGANLTMNNYSLTDVGCIVFKSGGAWCSV